MSAHPVAKKGLPNNKGFATAPGIFLIIDRSIRLMLAPRSHNALATVMLPIEQGM
ncbi:hypothetical protein A2U01_0042287, partial [Trifolium medium]|nr:hypothetical protein [Trifolium medium]